MSGSNSGLLRVIGPCLRAGEVISEKDKCGQCKAQKVVQEKKLLDVHVEKGHSHGQKITFAGEADEAVSCDIERLIGRCHGSRERCGVTEFVY